MLELLPVLRQKPLFSPHKRVNRGRERDPERYFIGFASRQKSSTPSENFLDSRNRRVAQLESGSAVVRGLIKIRKILKSDESWETSDHPRVLRSIRV